MQTFVMSMWALQLATCSGVSLVENGAPAAAIVLPEHAEPIAEYAAQEWQYHVERATGALLEIRREPITQPSQVPLIFIGATAAARDAGIDPDMLESEVFVLRTAENALYIVGNDGPGDPLSFSTTASGTLWGVYEVLERFLDVRWLWPGSLGEYIPARNDLVIPDMDEQIAPRFQIRNLRPGLGRRGFAEGHERLSFSPEHAERYAHDQTVFLRRHRMGRSDSSHYAQRRFGSGHSFGDWWEHYGAEHPEWFQLRPDGKRGPEDPARPHRVTMCVSNPGLHAKIVERWQEEHAKHPGEAVNIDISENDGSAECICDACRAWDGPPVDRSVLPDGLERSFEPVQAGTRYARFAKSVHELASAIDPNVKVTYYAYLNYFWPPENLTLSPNIVVSFVPWFRWAGWFPRTDAEHEWIKAQWNGWQRTGASLMYRPNWFLDGYSMPLVYMHQFADAFQHYARNGMIGTDFDSLQGQWAAQGPNLYLLSRIHVRPETPVDTLLDEYYAAFGPAAGAVRTYFTYWEDYATKNSPRAADTIRSRRGGQFRRYAHYALVADELYPDDVFPPAEDMLQRTIDTANKSDNPIHAERVRFLHDGLSHARQCAATAAVVNDTRTTMEEKKAAVTKLINVRRSLEHTNIANMDRAAIIETDSWEDIDILVEP